MSGSRSLNFDDKCRRVCEWLMCGIKFSDHWNDLRITDEAVSVDNLIAYGVSSYEVEELKLAGVYSCLYLSGHTIEGLPMLRDFSDRRVAKLRQAADKLTKHTVRAAVSRVIVVKNIPHSASEQDVSDLFESTIASCKTDLIKGSAIVDYESENRLAKVTFSRAQYAQNALLLDDTKIKGRKVIVEMLDSEGDFEDGLVPENVFLCVSGLPSIIRSLELRKFFTECGNLRKFKFAKSHGGKCKGHAYIEYSSQISFVSALSLNGSSIGSNVITVEIGVSLVGESSSGAGKGRRVGDWLDWLMSGIGFPNQWTILRDNLHITDKAVSVDNLIAYGVSLSEVEKLKCAGVCTCLYLSGYKIEGLSKLRDFSQESVDELRKAAKKIMEHTFKDAVSRLVKNMRDSALEEGDSRDGPDAVPENAFLYVSGLPSSIKDAELFGFFKECGAPRKLDVARFPGGKCKGHAYLEYASQAAFASALSLDGRSFRSNEITVKVGNESIRRVEGGGKSIVARGSVGVGRTSSVREVESSNGAGRVKCKKKYRPPRLD